MVSEVDVLIDVLVNSCRVDCGTARQLQRVVRPSVASAIPRSGAPEGPGFVKLRLQAVRGGGFPRGAAKKVKAYNCLPELMLERFSEVRATPMPTLARNVLSIQRPVELW